MLVFIFLKNGSPSVRIDKVHTQAILLGEFKTQWKDAKFWGSTEEERIECEFSVEKPLKSVQCSLLPISTLGSCSASGEFRNHV